MTNRPPIVVILGHVDHGKTTLLDFLRKSNVASREAGGITQHIRSFVLFTPELSNCKKITFIDTPGHEAFSNMRQRGSRMADLALLVIAGDDGIQPQTRQSIEFIKASKIPFIVVITKCDLPNCDADAVKTALADEEIIVEDLGGSVATAVVSAKTGAGIPELLELIDLTYQLNPPEKADNHDLFMTVVESKMDSKKGPVATVIINNGVLKVGQEIFETELIGKVRALIDCQGENVVLAEASTPVEILGLTKVPMVGSTLCDKPSKSIVKPKSDEKIYTDGRVLLMVKADVSGSLEAVLESLPPEVSVVHQGVGEISENEVLQAANSGAVIIGFNLKTSVYVDKLAETEKVKIKTFKIIYELLDYVDELLHPKETETIVGTGEILADFKIEANRIAGCRLNEGYLDKTVNIKIVRLGEIVGVTKARTLRMGKSTVEKIKAGTEFGAVFSPYIDFKIGDSIMATTG